MATIDRLISPARRLAAGTGRARLAGEIAAATLGGLLLAVVVTWPTMEHPASTIFADLGDPPVLAWQLAWFGHAYTSDLAGFFTGNTYWPLPHAVAFTDMSPSLGLLALGVDGPADALLRANLAYVLAYALNFTGAYALARQLGANRPGAVLAGVIFACTPWRQAQCGHLNVLSTGTVPLTFAFLLRGHGRPPRWGWALAGWLAAAWQVGCGMAVALPFLYVLALVVVVAVAAWLRAGRPMPPRPVLLADLAGMAVFGGVTLLIGSVLLGVAHDHPEARRDFAMLQLFSPPLRGLWTAMDSDVVWGGLTAGPRAGLVSTWEMALFPGLTAVLAGLVGLVWSAWPVRRRIWLAGAAAASCYLALGTTAPGGTPLWQAMRAVLPGMDAIRTSGRLILYAVLALALLAAGAVTRAGTRPWRRALLVLPVLAALEGLSTIPHPVVPPPPAALKAVTPADGPVLKLPITDWDSTTALWSTAGFYRLGNGYAAFVPREFTRLRDEVTGFPDLPSVTALRALGFRTVVVDRAQAASGPWQGAADRPVTGLPLDRRDFGDSVLFSVH